jgi:hypothetical protein
MFEGADPLRLVTTFEGDIGEDTLRSAVVLVSLKTSPLPASLLALLALAPPTPTLLPRLPYEPEVALFLDDRRPDNAVESSV